MISFHIQKKSKNDDNAEKSTIPNTETSKVNQCPPPLSREPFPEIKAKQFSSSPPPPSSEDSNNKLWIILAAVAGGVGLAYYMDWFSSSPEKHSIKKTDELSKLGKHYNV